MKALVKAYDEPGLWLQDMPKPEPGPEDVLIKVNEVAICGTDLHIYNWDQWAQEHVPVPMTVGHEYIGIIEEIGE
jgi:threonine 3-dehydrogenase